MEERGGFADGSLWQVIHKAKPCSFSDTELHAHLEKLGKKKIVLGGIYLFPF